VLRRFNELDATKLTVPIPIGDLANVKEAIIVASPILASIKELSSTLLSTQSQTTSPMVQNEQPKDEHMTSAPLISGSNDSATNVPIGLLTFVNAVVSAPDPRAKNSTFLSDPDSVLRYYNREEGSRNEYPYESDWGIVDSEPVVALIDAHVLFAQECLSRILAQSQVSTVRLPPTTASTSSLTASIQTPPPSTVPTTLSSPPAEIAELPEPVVMLLRPVRSIFCLFSY